MLGFGTLCLAYVDSVHQLQPIVEFVPAPNGATRALAIFTGVLLVGSGVALATGRKAHWFATALVVYFAAWIAFLHIPSAFLNPRLLRSPFWVRTFETLALSGGALVLAGLTSTPARERWIQTGRLLFGVSLPVFGALHFVYAENVASLVPAWYPWPLFWAYLTASGNVAAGAAIVTGRFARAAALLAGFMYGVYVLTLHIPRVVTIHRAQLAAGDPAALQLARGGMTSLCVAIGMSATAWIVAGSLMRSSANALSDANSGSDARTPERSERAVGQGAS
jgi:uncharacterized membrane protein YphA (DoxX/SURF4 family)